MTLLKENSKEIKVAIYSKSDCHLCDEAKSVLLAAQRKFFFDLVEVDITTDKILFEEYKEQIPVIFMNDRKVFKFRINEKELYKQLLASSC